MTRVLRLPIVLAAGVICTSSCEASRINNACDTFPDQYARLNASIYNLERASLDDPIIARSITYIRECYPTHRYRDLDNDLVLESVRRSTSGRYLAIFELYGVSDLRLVFVIEPTGNVTQSYLFGMN